MVYYLNIYYLRAMRKQWKSQKVLADELGVTVQVIHNWIKRKDKRIVSKRDENTNSTLVALVELKDNSLSGGGSNKKRQ